MTKRASDLPANPVWEVINAEHDWATVRLALDKLHAGEKLPSSEKKAFDKWHTAVTDVAFLNVSGMRYCKWSDKNLQTIHNHAKYYGIPCVDPPIRIPDVIAAFHALLAEKYALFRSKDEVNEVAETALQRKRAADADMAEDERDRRRGYLLPAAQARSAHVHWANRLRKASEQLGRKFGRMAQRILDDALADCEKHVVNMFDEGAE